MKFVALFLAGLFFIGTIAGTYLWLRRANQPLIPLDQIKTYDDCVAAGYPVMETFPEQCRTPDNRTFTKPPEVVLSKRTLQAIPQGQEIHMTGEVTCLPGSSPHTETEACEYGITNAVSNTTYALRDPGLKPLRELAINSEYAIKGVVHESSIGPYRVVVVVDISLAQTAE